MLSSLLAIASGTIILSTSFLIDSDTVCIGLGGVTGMGLEAEAGLGLGLLIGICLGIGIVLLIASVLGVVVMAVHVQCRKLSSAKAVEAQE